MLNQDRNLAFRKVIVTYLEKSGGPNLELFDAASERIIDRLKRLAEEGHAVDVEQDRLILRAERELFTQDPSGYLRLAPTNDPPAPQAAPPAEAPPPAPAAESSPSRPAEAVAPARSAGGRRLVGLLQTVIVAILASLGVAYALGLGGLSCGLIVRTCFDSGWIAATNETRSLAFAHGLGTLPSAITIYFSPNERGSPAYPIEYRWSDQFPGNPVTVSAAADAIRLEISSGAPLRAVWSSATGQWTRYDRGFIRVVASR